MTHSLEDAILQESASHDPDGWDTWLVYGDQLTERGDARGELIGLEHRLRTQPMPTAERAPLLAEVHRLQKAAEDALFEGKGRVSGLRLHWRGGFVVGAELWTYWGDAKELAFLEALVEDPVGRLFGSLRVHSHCGLDGIRTLAASPLLGRVRALVLSDIGLGGGTYNGVPARHGVDLIVASPHLHQLRSLDLSGNDFSDGPEQFRSGSGTGAPTPPPETFLDDKGAVLARLGTLSALDLRKCNLGDAGVASLVGPNGLSGLTRLNLGANRLSAAAVASLAASTRLGGLRVLGLRDNAIGVEGVRALAGARGLGALEVLDLSFALGDPGLALGDEVAPILAGAQGLAGLRELDLRGTGLSDAGLATLTASPTLRGCTVLR